MFFKKKKVSFKKENPENIIDELIKLGKLVKEKEEFKELLLQEFSCIRHCIKEYHYTYFNYDISLVNFEINIGNITYGFEEEKDSHVFVYIKVKDIVIYHNAKENSNSGLFEGVKSGWNHNSPEKLLEQISNDITIFRKAINNIEKSRSTKWKKEQEKLNELFKGKTINS
jgi:hypothetical protein